MGAGPDMWNPSRLEQDYCSWLEYNSHIETHTTCRFVASLDLRYPLVLKGVKTNNHRFVADLDTI
jgi:hypothetical protein